MQNRANCRGEMHVPGIRGSFSVQKRNIVFGSEAQKVCIFTLGALSRSFFVLKDLRFACPRYRKYGFLQWVRSQGVSGAQKTLIFTVDALSGRRKYAFLQRVR